MTKWQCDDCLHGQYGEFNDWKCAMMDGMSVEELQLANLNQCVFYDKDKDWEDLID